MTRANGGRRFLDGQALWFHGDSTAQESVVIDVRTEEGMSDLMIWFRNADVFVTISRRRPTQAQTRYDALKKWREDIVFVSISGLRPLRPRSELTCYDLIARVIPASWILRAPQ